MEDIEEEFIDDEEVPLAGGENGLLNAAKWGILPLVAAAGAAKLIYDKKNKKGFFAAAKDDDDEENKDQKDQK